MLCSLSRLSVNTIGDFMAVHTDTRNLARLPVQNEPLCLYAIQHHGFFAPHPWDSITPGNRTPAVQLLTAATAPALIVRDVLSKKQPVPETTLAAVIAADPGLYYSIPEIYRTPALKRLFKEIVTVKPGVYRWGFGAVAV